MLDVFCLCVLHKNHMLTLTVSFEAGYAGAIPGYFFLNTITFLIRFVTVSN